MTPGKLTLPTIWRGADWPIIVLEWKDQNGNPINLTGYQPFCRTKDFNLNPLVIDALNGVTQLSMPHSQSGGLTLGKYQWDWVFQNLATQFVWPPFLSGCVEVKQAKSTTPP